MIKKKVLIILFINYNWPFIGVYEYKIGVVHEIKIPIQRGKNIEFSNLTFVKIVGLIRHVNRIKSNHQPVIPGLAENIYWSSMFSHKKNLHITSSWNSIFMASKWSK